MNGKTKLLLFGAFVIATFGISAFLSAKVVANDWMYTVKEYSENNYYQCLVIYFMISILVDVLTIPLPGLEFIPVYVFSFPINLVYMFLPKLVSTPIIYQITNSCKNKEKSKEESLKVPLIQKVNTVIKLNPIFYGTLIKFASVPTSVKKYGLAALDISMKNFMICSILSNLVFVPIKAYVGYQFIDIYEKQKRGESTVNSGATLVLAVLSVLAMSLIIKKIIGVATSKEKLE